MENLKKMFLDVTNILGKGELKESALKLSQNFNENNFRDIEIISDILFELYIQDQKDMCFNLCLELKNLDFTGDPYKDMYIENIYVLLITLFEASGSDKDQIDFYRDKIISHYKPKTLKRILNGSLLCYDKIERALEGGNTERIYVWRLAHFKGLMFIRSLGGSETFSIEKIDEELKTLNSQLSKSL